MTWRLQSVLLVSRLIHTKRCYTVIPIYINEGRVNTCILQNKYKMNQSLSKTIWKKHHNLNEGVINTVVLDCISVTCLCLIDWNSFEQFEIEIFSFMETKTEVTRGPCLNLSTSDEATLCVTYISFLFFFFSFHDISKARHKHSCCLVAVQVITSYRNVIHKLFGGVWTSVSCLQLVSAASKCQQKQLRQVKFKNNEKNVFLLWVSFALIGVNMCISLRRIGGR